MRLYYKTEAMNKLHYFLVLLKQSAFPSLLFLLVFFLAISCSEGDTAFPDDSAKLRIENLSPFVITEMLVEAGGGGEHTYTNLQAGQVSEYKDFEYVYRYGFIRAIIDQDTLTLQPIDYVGEKQFTNGHYSYLIDITVENNQAEYMTLDFRED